MAMLINKIIEMLFPEGFTCICCGDEIFDGKYQMCSGCYSSLHLLEGRLCLHCSDPLLSDGNYCKRCKGRKFFYDRAVSPFVFEGNAANLIHGLKYNNRKYLAKPLSKFMVEKFLLERLYADIVIPVPLCKKRLKERGYNQSFLLAKEICKTLGLPLHDNLIRVKETPSQTSLDFIERQKNLKDAFKVNNKKEIKDKSVLLIDDVFTTGATARECSIALKNAGAKSVYVLTIAHTIKKEMNKKEGKNS